MSRMSHTNKAIAEQLKLLSDKIDIVGSEQKEIRCLVQEIKMLREQNEAQAKKIVSLERRIDDLEQYTRRDDVIISGLDTKHRSYASVVAADQQQTGADAAEDEISSLEDQVIEFLEDKNISVDRSSISACHVLGRRKKDTPPNIVLRFVSRKEKVRLLKQGNKLKGTKVFINEHLTAKNALIAKHARDLRRTKKIKDIWSRNGSIFIKKIDLSIQKVSCLDEFPMLGLPALQVN